MPQPRVGGKYAEIRAFTSTGFQFHWLPVRPLDRSGLAKSGEMVDSSAEITFCQGQLHRPTTHVLDRPSHSNRKASLVRSSAHEAHTVASEVTLACSGDLGEVHSDTNLPSPPSGLVVRREKRTPGSALAPSKSCSAGVYRRLKRRLECTLMGRHCKRRVVRLRKSPPHQLSGVKSSVPGPQEFQAFLQGPECSDSNRQHNYSLLHQQGGRYEIRLSLCPPVETSVLVSPQRNSFEGSTQSSDPDRVVPISAGDKSLVLQMGPATCRPFCKPVQPQTP